MMQKISSNVYEEKYKKIKEKCLKFQKENEFYNQVISVLLTIKKVVEKELSIMREHK
jgi:hypothetical protein